MICRTCGTEIADKAIVCYRCGTATTDPVRRPVPVRTSGGSPGPAIAMVMLVVLALMLGEAGRLNTYNQGRPLEIIASVLLTAAIVVLLTRIVRRRR